MPRLTKNKKKKQEIIINIKKTSAIGTRNVIKSLMVDGYYIIENEGILFIYFT